MPETEAVRHGVAATPAAGEHARVAVPNTVSTLDDEQATTPRAQLARARGLAAPYIPGGTDPDPTATAARERRYVRLLVALVVLIVGGSFVVSIAGLVLTGQLQ